MRGLRNRVEVRILRFGATLVPFNAAFLAAKALLLGSVGLALGAGLAFGVALAPLAGAAAGVLVLGALGAMVFVFNRLCNHNFLEAFGGRS